MLEEFDVSSRILAPAKLQIHGFTITGPLVLNALKGLRTRSFKVRDKDQSGLLSLVSTFMVGMSTRSSPFPKD